MRSGKLATLFRCCCVILSHACDTPARIFEVIGNCRGQFRCCSNCGSPCVDGAGGCLGGRLVINAIRKEDNDRDQLLRLNYREHLWMEREIKTVANVTHSGSKRE